MKLSQLPEHFKLAAQPTEGEPFPLVKKQRRSFPRRLPGNEFQICRVEDPLGRGSMRRFQAKANQKPTNESHAIIAADLPYADLKPNEYEEKKAHSERNGNKELSQDRATRERYRRACVMAPSAIAETAS